MLTVFVRTIVIFVVLITSMRIMGKRQVGELQISELVVTLMMSELAVLPISDAAVPVSHALVPILLLIAAEVILSFLEMKSNLLKKILGGKPAMLINRGVLDTKALAHHRIEIEELMAELRLSGVFDIADVHYAVLEENGRISVKTKAERSPASAKDASVKVDECDVARAVVIDGEPVVKTVSAMGFDISALTDVLAGAGIATGDVFLMTVDDGMNYTIYRRNEGSPICGTMKGGRSR